MGHQPHNQTVGTTYGARPVSVDLARGRHLAVANDPSPATEIDLDAGRALNHAQVADRLSVAHWPRGHQVFVCALDGGTGRTTITGLLSTVLAELPYAYIWPPIAIIDGEQRGLSASDRRWDVIDDQWAYGHKQSDPACTRAGAWNIVGSLSVPQRRDFSALIIDSPVGLPSDVPGVRDDARASVVLMVRPDRASLADAANALVWMNDHTTVTRERVTVVVNHGVGQSDRGSKATATALGIRCAVIHSLAADSTLGPGRVLPSGRALPTRVRRNLARIGLDIWSRSHPPVTASRSPHPLEPT